MHIALFCQVVDNYGDIGVCWRLARQWMAELHDIKPALKVTLWVDDLPSFKKICAAVDPVLSAQFIEGVLIRPWRDAELAGANVVIEAFACHLPPQLEAAMRAERPGEARPGEARPGEARPDEAPPGEARPKWINLEYLSAEDWIETCHCGASPQISGLTKYFFFPGFTAKTGGLLCERDLQARRLAFLRDGEAQLNWWQQLGWAGRPSGMVVSLFCYPHAPLAGLFSAWQAGLQSVLCLVPDSIARAALADCFALDEARLVPGLRLQRGALTVQIIPFVDQPAYDHLLWQCDLNIVRGEDSFVRAQWAERPFLWHIYPQDDEIHLDKLQAFLMRYLATLPDAMSATMLALSLAWNRGQGGEIESIWPEFVAQLPMWREHAAKWCAVLAQNGNLADNLLQFIQKID